MPIKTDPCVLRLIQLLHLCRLVTNVNEFPHDLVIDYLFIVRHKLTPASLRTHLESFVTCGFNPFLSTLDPVSKIRIKSIIARCDSCIK